MTNQELNLAVAKACGYKIFQIFPMGIPRRGDEARPGVIFQCGKADRYWFERPFGTPWNPTSDVELAIECMEELFRDGWQLHREYDGFGVHLWDDGMLMPKVYGADTAARALCLTIVGMD